MEPLITVIVPVYKVEAYLDRCVQSMTDQTYQNLEILLVDDGSPDRSGEICDRWAEKDSRVRVIHQENQGLGAARNTGLDAARGEFACFVDSDDYVSPNFCALLLAMMDENTDITECGYLETQSNDADFDSDFRPPTRYSPLEAVRENIRDEIFRQIACNKLYRREILEDLRFPVGVINEDEFFTYQALAKAGSLVRSDTRLYAYRQRGGSIMHNPFSLNRLDGIRAKRQRLSFLEENMPQLVPQAKNDLLMSCLYGMQGTMRSLRGGQRQQAEAFLKDTLARLKPVPVEEEPSGKRRFLLRCAGSSLKGTARALNILENLHILK